MHGPSHSLSHQEYGQEHNATCKPVLKYCWLGSCPETRRDYISNSLK